MEASMSVTFSTIDRPAVTNRSGTFARLVGACWDAVAGYFVRRSAIATLRELDDRALQDIGIARCQIEAAVQGFILLPDQGRMS
jgi:uncharacterized protein YjiS (DUF1127 family)